MIRSGEIYIQDLVTHDTEEVAKAPKGSLEFETAGSKPYLFILKDTGYIEQIFVSKGHLLNCFGPFTNVIRYHYNESLDKLFVLDIHFYLRIISCFSKYGEKRGGESELHKWSHPCLFHSYEVPNAIANLSEDVAKKYDQNQKARAQSMEVCNLLRDYLKSDPTDDTLLKNLFLQAETLKDIIPPGKWPSMVTVLKKINHIYYEKWSMLGLPLSINKVLDEWSWSTSQADALSSSVSCCDITADKKLFAICDHSGNLSVYNAID